MTREAIVMIDAGHGGRDPGAIAKSHNVIEKDITLLIANELFRTLEDTDGYKPVLIREDDSFIYLDQRYQKARQNSGDIFIDDQSIYSSKISSLRKNISLVSQDTTLFDDTVKNNIAYANLNSSDEEIDQVAKLSFAYEFIDKLPNKYDTLIGENGVRLSGGEKQRIAIARMMLKKPKILILDEATSALDSKTEKLVLDSIDEYFKNSTKIIIAHRLTTIRNSDKIIVMSKGKIIEQGKHSNLMKNKGLYYEMWNKQKEIKKQVI